MKRRASRPSVSPEASALLRAALEPRYGRKLDDGEVGGMADRLRRLSDVMLGWEAEDRVRDALASGCPGGPPASPSLPRSK